MKFLGPSSSLQVNKITDSEKEGEELSNQMYMLTENMQCSESLHEDDIDQGDVDIDAIMQTLGDQTAKNPEDDNEEVANLADNSEDDGEIIDDSNSLN